jgi:ribosomal protein S27AE
MRATTRTGGCAATTIAFAATTFAVASTTDVLLVVRRRAVVAIHYRCGTGVVFRSALTLRVVCGQCGRRARKQQKQTGH